MRVEGLSEHAHKGGGVRGRGRGRRSKEERGGVRGRGEGRG